MHWAVKAPKNMQQNADEPDLGIDCAYLVHFSQERVNLQARCLGIGHASRVSQSRAKHLAYLGPTSALPRPYLGPNSYLGPISALSRFASVPVVCR